MNNLLIQSDDLVPVTVYVRVVKTKKQNRQFIILSEEKAKELLQDAEKAGSVTVLNAKFKQPTWETHQRMYAEALLYNPSTGQKELDVSIWSDAQLKSNLVEWDLADENGRVYPPTAEYINQLPTVIAGELLSQYRNAILVNEEEVGE